MQENPVGYHDHSKKTWLKRRITRISYKSCIGRIGCIKKKKKTKIYVYFIKTAKRKINWNSYSNGNILEKKTYKKPPHTTYVTPTAVSYTIKTTLNSEHSIFLWILRGKHWKEKERVGVFPVLKHDMSRKVNQHNNVNSILHILSANLISVFCTDVWKRSRLSIRFIKYSSTKLHSKRDCWNNIMLERFAMTNNNFWFQKAKIGRKLFCCYPRNLYTPERLHVNILSQFYRCKLKIGSSYTFYHIFSVWYHMREFLMRWETVKNRVGERNRNKERSSHWVLSINHSRLL